MTPQERRTQILEELKSMGKVDVNALSERFRCSKVTIRTDIRSLEKDGLLTRTHGGAVSQEEEDKSIYERDCYSLYKDKVDLYDDIADQEYSNKLQILIDMFDLVDIMMSDNAEITNESDRDELEEHQYYIYKLNERLQEIYDYLTYHHEEFNPYISEQEDMYLTQISFGIASDEEYNWNLEEKYKRRYYIHECSSLLEEAFAEYPFTYPLDYPDLPGMTCEVETIDRLSQLIYDMSYY